MRTGDSFDTMFLTDAIKHSACAAICIADKYARDAFGFGFDDGPIHRRRNLIRVVVIDRREALQFNMFQAKLFTYREDFARDHPARNDPHGLC